MKFKLQLIGFFVCFCSFIFAQEDFDSTTVKKVGDYIPSFTITSLSGRSLSSIELNGKVVLINFWATWCPPCRAEFPFLQKNIWEKIRDNDFVVIAISRGEKRDTVQKFIDQNKFTFPIYLDEEAKTYNLFANKYIPRNFVIGKDGKIKWATIGFNKKEFEEMIKLIEEEIKK